VQAKQRGEPGHSVAGRNACGKREERRDYDKEYD